MGAGDFPAGMGPAGFDPVVAPPPPRDAKLPSAIWFDGATRTFLFDAQGRLVPIHPVDQSVALSILVELGKLSSAPTVGSSARRATGTTEAARLADVETRMRAAVKRRVDAGDIQIVAIVVTSPVPGRTVARFRYLNLRIPGSQVRTVGSP